MPFSGYAKKLSAVWNINYFHEKKSFYGFLKLKKSKATNYYIWLDAESKLKKNYISSGVSPDQNLGSFPVPHPLIFSETQYMKVYLELLFLL